MHLFWGDMHLFWERPTFWRPKGCDGSILGGGVLDCYGAILGEPLFWESAHLLEVEEGAAARGAGDELGLGVAHARAL